MRLAIKTVFIVAFLSIKCIAQQTDLDFLVQKIKIDYPGFAEKTKNIDFDRFVAKTIAENKSDTFKTMATIVDFFHDRHLDLFRSKDSIDAGGCKQNLEYALKYLKSSVKKKRFEGFWLSEANHCVMAIIQDGKNSKRLVGYVIECRDNSALIPGMVLAEFDEGSKNNYFTKTLFSKTRQSYYVWSKFRNDSVFTAGPYNKWKKLRVYKGPLLSMMPVMPDIAIGHSLDKDNFLITIPSSSAKNGEIVDSIVKANHVVLSQTKNLIVDIRTNTGGTVRAYSALLPLLYTNPILKVNSSLYATVDDANIRQMDLGEYIAAGGNDSTYLNYWNYIIKMERDYAGQFIPFPQDTLKLDTILPYPKNVGIIINYGCQSAAEMFLLDAQQSKKITLFGEHTMGAVDYYDFYSQNTPSGKYKLYIATARRNIPEGGSKLDGIGIQPDVQINDSDTDWVNAVRLYYDKH